MCSVRPSSGFVENILSLHVLIMTHLATRTGGRICAIVDSSCCVNGSSIVCWLRVIQPSRRRINRRSQSWTAETTSDDEVLERSDDSKGWTHEFVV
jgi:hypothetical protein